MVIQDHGRLVNVTGYNPSQGVQENCRIVSAAVAYDDPKSGNVSLLIIHQAIEISELKQNLLSTMQLRLNDVEVSEVPKFLTDKPDDRTHAITLTSQDEAMDTLTIPLSLHGVTSYFPTRKPTMAEMRDCTSYDLTYELPEWDPQTDEFQRMEDAMTGNDGTILERSDALRSRGRVLVSGLTCAPSASIPTLFDHDNFVCALQSNRLIDRVDVSTSSRRPRIDHITLSQKWGTSLEAAKRTIERTTQRGLRTVLHPSLSRRFRTNDRQLRYRRLAHPVYADTLIAGSKSRRQNKYAEIFVTTFGWTRAFPMRQKSEAHETLSLLFKRDGVPPAIIVDGSKEQTLGEFRRKAREADCHVKQTEPYSPWQNAAEGGIRELKRGVARKMVKTKSPKKLWDDCLELEAYIRSNTAHDIFELNGEVPETIVSGETSDISQFCELEWYEWVYFRDTSVQFPEDKAVLGRYLGPSIDIGPAMTAKILKANGEVVYRSTY